MPYVKSNTPFTFEDFNKILNHCGSHAKAADMLGVSQGTFYWRHKNAEQKGKTGINKKDAKKMKKALESIDAV